MAGRCNGRGQGLAECGARFGIADSAVLGRASVNVSQVHYDDDAARKLMFKIFDMLGSDPLVATYRRKMMSLFY